MQSSVVKLPISPEEEAAGAARRGAVDEALTVLMDSYGKELYRHCQQVLGDADLAADVHQTVFVQAYRDMRNFSGRSSYRTWLYGIARHRCLDAIKMRRRRRLRFVLSDSVVALDAADPSLGALDQLQQVAESRAMNRALQTLKPEVRIALLLRYREDMSFEEMAEVCGERAATLQARVARGLPKLRRAVEKQR